MSEREQPELEALAELIKGSKAWADVAYVAVGYAGFAGVVLALAFAYRIAFG